MDKKSAEILEKENKLLKKALDYLDEYIMIQDNHGKNVFRGSKSKYATYGWEGENLQNKSSEDLSKIFDDSGFGISMLEKKPIRDLIYTCKTTKGLNKYLIVDEFPIFDGDEIIGVSGIARDYTKIFELSKKLFETQHQLILATDRQNNGTIFTFDDILGESDCMVTLMENAKKVALSNPNILITGETGTGKELLAQSIHNAGPTIDEPFVAINCGAVPETLLESIFFGTVKGAYTGAENKPGLFEEAQKGTLFLDELNSMSLSLQAKLLRVLEYRSIRRLGDSKERPVEARILCAMNISADEALDKGILRRDLFYRLSTITFECPPLRDRKGDMLLLANSFIHKFNKLLGRKMTGLSKDVQRIFNAYTWPGNIRELKHVVEHAMHMSKASDDVLIAPYLPSYLQKINVQNNYRNFIPDNETVNDLPKTLFQIEKAIILQALQHNNGNVNRAAKELNISRQNLFYRIKKFEHDES